MLYRVEDPQRVYPIVAVDVVATSKQDAKRLALAAMMGTGLDQVDAIVVDESLAQLTIEPIQ